jgi:hypothetical protein
MMIMRLITKRKVLNALIACLVFFGFLAIMTPVPSSAVNYTLVAGLAQSACSLERGAEGACATGYDSGYSNPHDGPFISCDRIGYSQKSKYRSACVDGVNRGIAAIGMTDAQLRSCGKYLKGYFPGVDNYYSKNLASCMKKLPKPSSQPAPKSAPQPKTSTKKTKSSVPIGCPGSAEEGLVAPFPANVCSKIPAGCPGSSNSLKQGAKPLPASKCPYVVGPGQTDSTKRKPVPKPKTTPSNPSTPTLTEDPAVKCTKDNCDLIAKYVNPAIDLFSLSFGLIAVISIIFGAIQYSASQGDPQKTAAAKSRISNTILALVAYLFLYAFLQFIIPGGAFH